MLCTRCRRHALSRLSSFYTTTRSSHTVPSTPDAAPAVPPSATTPSTSAPTPAQSSALTGISQPLSTPFFPSTSSAKSAASPPQKLRPTKLEGSVSGGQELKGLAYLKAQPVILAKEDDEYPPWLWTLLSNTGAPGEVATDLASLTKKQRSRYEKKQEKLRANLPTPIPLHEQSKNLTEQGEDAKVSLERRQEIVRSARAARRKSIREDNFLRTM